MYAPDVNGLIGDFRYISYQTMQQKLNNLFALICQPKLLLR